VILSALLGNTPLVAGLLAWSFAQTIKLPIGYLQNRTWDWSLLLRPGRMPSSHSALITAASLGVGLTEGFDSPLFGLSVALALIVVYDATGIRRQAGRHAETLNALIRDLFESHQLRHQELREVLGHSPLEALVGVLIGLAIAILVFVFWPF
jgi:uncharacterized protein